MKSIYRSIPSIDKVLNHPKLLSMKKEHPRNLQLYFARKTIQSYRQAHSELTSIPTIENIVDEILNNIDKLKTSSLKSVINATGVILHTNLGRAPLSDTASHIMCQINSNYSNLEYDLNTGKRLTRLSHVEELFQFLTGAESVLIVNNNASAIFLVASVLSKQKEILISKGESVEIGGGFRISDIINESGAKLIEVGTTNKTYIEDYQKAITSECNVLLKVHTSNFKIIGFTESTEIEEMARLSRENNLYMIHDLGSGCLVDSSKYGLNHEPTVQESIQAGMDLVLFSTDKLLGGPQAGVILGKKELIDQIKIHPLARALRSDKASIAGLSATLMHYVNQEFEKEIPIWRMISRTTEDVLTTAQKWNSMFSGSEIIAGESTIGGGSLPGETIPSWLIGFKEDIHFSSYEMAKILRNEIPIPIIGKVQQDKFLLDPRTVLMEEEKYLENAIIKTLSKN
ncbi:MAG: L-seryl-tRNA(Sec) selenium transferase [Chloroflexi bacterium]|nr:L-seryl-tRNA(Sec) selenium transferase [Chloroflexota bacterium]|tara:strand:- start:2652 stop:4022 length:1371 start_codon:yes stop_codon:yes gene_type:complete